MSFDYLMCFDFWVLRVFVCFVIFEDLGYGVFWVLDLMAFMVGF